MFFSKQLDIHIWPSETWKEVLPHGTFLLHIPYVHDLLSVFHSISLPTCVQCEMIFFHTIQPGFYGRWACFLLFCATKLEPTYSNPDGVLKVSEISKELLCQFHFPSELPWLSQESNPGLLSLRPSLDPLHHTGYPSIFYSHLIIPGSFSLGCLFHASKLKIEDILLTT